MAPKLPLHHSLHLPTAEAHLGPGGIRTCCQHVVVTALMARVILTDKMGKQTWQRFTQPLYLVFTHHCSSDNKEPRTATARPPSSQPSRSSWSLPDAAALSRGGFEMRVGVTVKLATKRTWETVSVITAAGQNVTAFVHNLFLDTKFSITEQPSESCQTFIQPCKLRNKARSKTCWKWIKMRGQVDQCCGQRRRERWSSSCACFGPDSGTNRRATRSGLVMWPQNLWQRSPDLF